MFAWNSHGTELSRFSRQPITRAAIAVMLLIPLLYGAMYVWAFWDPTTRMDALPVALVNQDAGAVRDGKHVSFGTEVVDELVEDASLGWQVTDAATAAAGLNTGRYYFAVTVPSDFSASITSLGQDDPTPASIRVTYDDTNSFLASTLGKSAMLQVQDAVREKVGQEAVDTLLVGLGDARDGFATASDGAFTLREGLTTAAEGADTLNVGAQQLAEGAGTLAKGTNTLAAGATKLSGKLADYVAGVTTAAEGATTLKDGARDLASATAGLTTLSDGVKALADPKTGAPALADGVSTMVGSLRTLASGATQYAEGATTLAEGAQTWTTGARSWQQAAASATGGDLATGTAAIAKGADGLSEATAASGSLGSGAASVASGTKDLAAGLDTVDAVLEKAKAALAEGDTATAAALLTKAQSATESAADSAGQLATGAAKVSAGVASAHSGAADLATGASALKGGWATLHQAVEEGGKLEQPLGRLEAGAATLEAGATSLSAGAAHLADPATLASAQQLSLGATQVATALTTMNESISDPATGFPALQGGAKALASGMTTLADGFTAPEPTKGLLSGATALRDGAGTLAAGLADADTGAHSLRDGLDTVAAATPKLASGLTTAVDGSDTLGSKLADGTQEILDDQVPLREQRAQAVASPVGVASSHVHEAESWGEGFAPFFIPLALWVGALITWLLLRPLQTRALMTSVNGFRATWGSLSSALTLAVGQVLIMLTVMHFAIGLDPQNVVATVGFTLLAAAAFFALQQFFQVTLGSAVGKVVIIVLLMIQLASAGGTYPIQTTPAFLQAISPYLPMTYVVTGLREAITGGIEVRFWTSMVVLAAIFVVSLAATSLATARKRMWTMSRLHPALSI